jgi:hypothetical protein
MFDELVIRSSPHEKKKAKKQKQQRRSGRIGP